MRFRLLCFGLLISFTSNAQVVGGARVFEFLRMPSSAQVTALGGINVSNPDANVSLAWQNPSQLRPALHNQLALGYNKYFADIANMQLQYAYHSPKLKTTFGGGVQFINYGQFVQTDIYGNENGEVKASEFAVSLSAAKQYKTHWHYGAALKIVGSNLGSSSASGVLADVGISWVDKENLITVGAVAKNMGVMTKSYDGNNRGKEPLPFDLQLGISKRFAHLPLRLMLTAHHLYQWDIRYNDPNDVSTNNIFGAEDTTTQGKAYFGDKLFRHLIFGAEILLGKRLTVYAGYNHLRRKEMSLQERQALTGFSFGASVHLNKLHLYYARSFYHLAGANNEFGLNLELNKLMSFGKGTHRESWKAEYPNWE